MTQFGHDGSDDDDVSYTAGLAVVMVVVAMDICLHYLCV